MKIIYSDDIFALKDTVVALGNFDGVHIAHQALIQKAVAIANANNLTSVVYTFSEHPKNFLGQSIKLLTTNNEKEMVFENMGVDVLVYQKPTAEFLKVLPEAFIKDLVIDKLGAKHVVVGEHYRFGAKAKGDCILLKHLADKLGVVAHVEKLIFLDNNIISSSAIRELLLNGDLQKANKLLGRNYSFNGNIVHGNHFGTEIGFPTANIYIDNLKIIPKFGVYACKAVIDNIEYNSVVNIGVKPTIGSERPLIEAHIIGGSGNFYDKNAVIQLCEFLREEKKFSNIAELKYQIKIDVDFALEYFSNNFK